jgi:hypothetical protein
MQAWLRHASIASRVVADHAELWLPAVLAWVAFLGWLPLVLAVARTPDEGDLTVFGAALVTSGDWPVNAVRLGASLLALALLANSLVAFGEAVLLRLLEGRSTDSSRSAFLAGVTRLWRVQLLAAVPGAVALVALVATVAVAAVGELQSPDIGGRAWVRITARVAPFGAAVVLALIAGQAFTAAAARRLARTPAPRLRDAVVGALRDLAQRPAQRIGLAAVILVVQVAYLLLCLLLLRVLWAPIGVALGEGRAITSGAPLLLVGFVAIWLCLVLAGGALHAFAAAWWSLELAATARAEPSAREEAAAT